MLTLCYRFLVTTPDILVLSAREGRPAFRFLRTSCSSFELLKCCRSVVTPPGILVLSAREGGPAFKAGLKGSSRDEYGRLVLGDIITAVNGVKMKSSSDLYRILDKCQVG